MAFYSRCLTLWLQSIFVEMMTVTKIPPYGVFNTRLQLIKINKDLTARINGQTLAISSIKLGEEKLQTNMSFSLGWLKVALEGNFWVFSLVLGQLTVHHTPPSPPPSPQFVFSLSWQMPCKKKWSPQLCSAFYVFFWKQDLRMHELYSHNYSEARGCKWSAWIIVAWLLSHLQRKIPPVTNRALPCNIISTDCNRELFSPAQNTSIEYINWIYEFQIVTNRFLPCNITNTACSRKYTFYVYLFF